MKNILLIDNYDSFTFNLYDYFLRLHTNCTVIRNDACTLDELTKNHAFDALVISPGPKTPQTAGITLDAIAQFGEKKPILGVCLGHQALGIAFGAQLVKAHYPMHGKTSSIVTENHPLFLNLPLSFQVMRYHSLVLENLENTPLKSIANTPEGEIMAIAHDSLPICGLQFHPESILTEYGLEILQNWITWCKCWIQKPIQFAAT